MRAIVKSNDTDEYTSQMNGLVGAEIDVRAGGDGTFYGAGYYWLDHWLDFIDEGKNIKIFDLT